MSERSNISRTAARIEFGIVIGLLAIAYAVVLFVADAFVRRGLSNVDDGFFALAAKALATGPGYGIWDPSGNFSAFDPYNGLGPTLIIPVAAFTKIFGSLDWMPGAISFATFSAQGAVLLALLIRRFSACSSLAFAAMALLLILCTSASQWYFGVLVGEPAALGFLLLGITLAATSNGKRSLAFCGLCFGLAVLTKEISLFATLGTFAAWLLMDLKENRKVSVSAVATLITGIVAPVLLFEAYKIAALGISGYASLWQKVVITTRIIGTGGGGLTDRLGATLAILQNDYLRNDYLSVGVAAVLAMISLLVAVRFALSAGLRDSRVRFIVLLWASAITTFAYFVFVSSLWPRYIWLGVMLANSAIAGPLLFVKPPWRLVLLVAAFAVTFEFGPFRTLVTLPRILQEDTSTVERAVVAHLIDRAVAQPVVAQNWNSFDDVLYLTNFDRRRVYDPVIFVLRGQRFLAVINSLYSDARSAFVADVPKSCTLLTPRYFKKVFLYECGARFWSHYPIYDISGKDPSAGQRR